MMIEMPLSHAAIQVPSPSVASSGRRSSTSSLFAFGSSATAGLQVTPASVERETMMPYSEALPDFVKLAEAFGAVGLRAEKPDQLDDVIAEMIACDNAVIADICVDQKENVFPMILHAP